ncbi:MAG: hypothetical protein L0229_09245 [Blastocatellia bacterium]|nr:hypothetical protein [Blastocatellia bacterium]
MNVIDLSKEPLSLDELLAKARQGSVLVQDAAGDRYLLSPADDLALEVELLRKNHEFLIFLDSCKAEEKTLSMEEVEKRLR